MWGATTVCPSDFRVFRISIHAPRVGSDFIRFFRTQAWPISIHAPRVGSDVLRQLQLIQAKGFQSTLPVWGATPIQQSLIPGTADFNPRSPCGERLTTKQTTLRKFLFQSTLPVWGATGRTDRKALDRHFNPRSPCGERRTPGCGRRRS